jgi:hypothetical protein
MMKKIETAATYLGAAVFASLLMADPALAQFTGGGAAPEFQKGLSTLLWWVFVAGVFVAIASFIFACVALFTRNLMGFAGGVLGVVIGGALMAKAPTVVTALTNLQSIF